MARIVIDYTPALRQTAGIGRYTRNLVAALAQLDRQNSYTLFCAGGRQAAGTWPANFALRTTPFSARYLAIAWHRFRLPLPGEWLTGAGDLFHSPDFTLPPLAHARGVVTVHDLSYLRLPECADPGLRQYLEAAVPPSVARAHRILADSENTRRDIVELLSVPESKVSVVHGGVDKAFCRVSDPAMLSTVRERYHLPTRFVLAVGTLEPRKNYPRLIAAFGTLCQASTLPQHLVIAGKRGWLYDGIARQIEGEGLAGRVHLIGFVADGDLPALYSLADLFVFPSLYEGFGMPPLEAMACGTPVIAADNSSLPEAVGNAGILVNAEDVDDLAATMGHVLSDIALRDRLVAFGMRQAAQFSWDRAAGELIEAYRLTLA